MNSPFVGPPAAHPRRWRRWFVVCAGTALAMTAGGLQISGVFAGKVLCGRSWPESERLSLDDVEHRAWDGLLGRYVDESGRVDYAAWKHAPDDVARLDEYLALLSRADPIREAARPARLAFWINAYNALTVRGILREYPTCSIQDHASRLGGYNIWRDLLLYVGNRRYSLAEIEHQLLRPLHEPRIHFAIVCASRGCPRLLNRAYTASELEQQLHENARDFFADPQKLQYDTATGLLRMSPILEWYADDFGSDQATLLETVRQYFPPEIAGQWANRRDLHVTYLEYDWTLNEIVRMSDEAPAPPVDRALEGDMSEDQP